MNIIEAREKIRNGASLYDLNLRVVNYDRVSTDKEEQLNSLVNQENYFKDMIKDVYNWRHVGSYSDEGISGTQVYKRNNFLRMIEDARLGKFDLIVTKEISRFARNTIDSIKYVQLLLSYGVIVFFVSDNINTINPDSEFRLTLMASMAQDEVRKLSERVKFGIKRSIKDGKVGGSGLYGYIKKNCKLEIDEKEAKVVKKIFLLYSSGEYGFKKIGEILALEKHYTRKGKVFSDATLKKMLQNPRYKGWYTANLSEVEDYKTHKKIKKPRDEWIMYKDKDGKVPAIVSEELWERANSIYNERTKNKSKNVLNKEFYLENKKYTSKIICFEHNKSFIRSASGKRKENPVWQCNEYLRHGINGCKSPIIYEKKLDEIFIPILDNIIGNKEELITKIVNDYITIIKQSNSFSDIELIKKKIKEHELSRERLIEMSLKKMINDNEFMDKYNNIKNEIDLLNNKIIQLQNIEYLIDNKSIDKITNVIKKHLDVKNNIYKYFDLFIDKVIVSKINDDRKNLKLVIGFNYARENIILNVNMHKSIS